MSGPRLSGPGPSPGISLVAGGSGSLTSTALVTGGGGGTLQTPSATSTLDSSGNMSLPGRLILSAGATTSAQTDLLINPTTKASGNLIDAQVNSVSQFSVTSVGAGVFVGNVNVASILASANARVGAAGNYSWSGRSAMTSPSDGVITISNNAVSDFNRLQLGGTTSSFPAIKRNSTAINFRLADDSGDAPITAAGVTGSSFTTTGSILFNQINQTLAKVSDTNGVTQLMGGTGAAPGAYLRLHGPTHATLPNQAVIGTPTGPPTVFTLGFTPSTPIGGTPAQGQGLSVLQCMELLTIAAAASTTTTMLVPAGAIVLSVSVRVTTIIPTAATFTVTIGASGSFNTVAVPVAATTTDQGTALGAKYIPTAAGVTITPNLTPGAATGVVRITVSYVLITPPTS